MRALEHKLLRDLVRLRGQAITIALVIACGVASYVALYSAYGSLTWGRDAYYASSRFADVFAHLKRAPNDVTERLERVPGVATVEVREVESIMLPLEDLPEPAVGRVVSVQGGREPALSAPFLTRGRFVEPGHPDEVVVVESFASAHHLDPGATLPAILNGVRRELHVVGVALSPEYIFAVADFDPMPDPSRFAVLWMERDLVAPAFGMEGAFNDVQVRLQAGASELAVLEGVDRVLEPYGGMGAYGRDRQVSNRFLAGELQQLGTMATVVAAIFLGVAAFLLNIVLGRVVHLQRAQIATLRAVGYSSFEIARHYLALAAIVVLAGVVVGSVLGAFLGRGMMNLYAPYFRYPAYGYRLEPRLLATGAIVSLASGLAATLGTLRRVARLPPAEAMRPESPPSYRPSILERVGVGRLLGPMGRMVLREVGRRPARTALSSLGIALAIASLVGTRFGFDAMDTIQDLEFETAERDDLTVGFLRPVSGRARAEIAHLEGVVATEEGRTVPVRVRAGHRAREVALTGVPHGARLRRAFEWPPREVVPPEEGVVLTRTLADVLGVKPGDRVEIDVLEGDRRARDVVVAALSNDLFGLSARMSLDALHAMLGEGDVITQVAVLVDPSHESDVSRRLKELPLVGGVGRRRAVIERFKKQSAETMNVTTTVLVLFAATIAIGIVYNDARISLSMRERDLASLRVLGFTRREIAAVLLGELATYVALAVPLGLLLGRWLALSVVSSSDPESYRLPLVVSARTDSFAVSVTLAASALSMLLVREKLDRLDLVGVLKTRE